MTTISAEDLTIAYGQRTIIDKLSFYIPEGKITTIIGANGCGKSSLLKALTRLLPPKQGIVYLNGQNIATLETKEVAKKLALLPQVQEATNGITVYELVSTDVFPINLTLEILVQLTKSHSLGYASHQCHGLC